MVQTLLANFTKAFLSLGFILDDFLLPFQIVFSFDPNQNIFPAQEIHPHQAVVVQPAHDQEVHLLMHHPMQVDHPVKVVKAQEVHHLRHPHHPLIRDHQNQDLRRFQDVEALQVF